ncbi:MAG: FliO/MopB family protein [Thermodesulfovibrionales bacterium]
MIGIYIQVIFALLSVIGLIFVFGYLLKKRQGRPSLINVLAYHSFGQRKGIAALKVGAEILLLGITPTDIKLLKTLEEDVFTPEVSKDISDKLSRLNNIKKLLNEK